MKLNQRATLDEVSNTHCRSAESRKADGNSLMKEAANRGGLVFHMVPLIEQL
jgi:hypothetical protein